jgi:hypothetical protein
MEGDIRTQNLASLITDILQAWNNKLHVAGIFCDLTEAFDCINHEILIEKLTYCMVNKPNIDWFISYLLNCKQRVNINIKNVQNNNSK